ncbi:putative GTPase IMAP family member 8-like [Triplophysa rosa]|uniref:GTPase IMAP family member 8 n=1 Tax=Triplophysa rosa TaxID=992332 RepID=A0A9W7TP71_TRIRA|nr:putative GTPase IMAP family member 8-like [Triplophysa rosa]
MHYGNILHPFSSKANSHQSNKLKLGNMTEQSPFKIKWLILSIEGMDVSSLYHVKACLNMVLLGKTGAGKSATGNTILGRPAFISKKSSNTITQDVTVESGTVCGVQVKVYDTPGFCDTQMREQEIQEKFQNVLQECESKPCVFLLVMRADRFTAEEQNTVKKIEKLLGQQRIQKTWILFTRGDELEDENMTIEDFINDTEPWKKLIQKYEGRYHVFNNKNKTSDQVNMLLKKVSKLYKQFKEMAMHVLNNGVVMGDAVLVFSRFTQTHTGGGVEENMN